MNNLIEVNFDGLVGPNYMYSGLSVGNHASIKNKNKPSNPRQAAKNCLEKMYYLHRQGLVQGILPPHERPDFGILRYAGYTGTDSQLINKVYKRDPELLKACYSASSMWAANAATVTPCIDAADGKTHITVANLNYTFHRSMEAQMTQRVCNVIFNDRDDFIVHGCLPKHRRYDDEGAANNMRICKSHGSKAVQVYVYGHCAKEAARTRLHFRQSKAASEAIAYSHGVDPEQTAFVEQHQKAVEYGAFHNDIIATSNENFLLFHEYAFTDNAQFITTLQNKFGPNNKLYINEVKESEVPLENAVKSFLFNSQIVSLADGSMRIITPVECTEDPLVEWYIERLLSADNPVQSRHVVNLRESTQNGGGPACMRLRVPMPEEKVGKLHSGCMLNEHLYNDLNKWIERNYRDQLLPADLGDPELVTEIRTALDELTSILSLPAIYSFQVD